MIKLNFENTSIQLKSKWEEINLHEYIILDQINRDSEFSNLDKTISLLTTLSDKPSEMHSLLMESDANGLNKIVEAMEITKIAIQNIPPPTNQKLEFTIDDKKYKLKEDFKSVSLETMVNIETLLKTNPNDNATVIALGVLFREVKPDGKLKAFNEKDYEHFKNELIKKISLLDVFHYSSNFINGEVKSIKTMQSFSMEVL